MSFILIHFLKALPAVRHLKTGMVILPAEATHSFNQQLLAGLPDALESHVDILLSRQTVDAAIQGMRYSLGHLERTACSW